MDMKAFAKKMQEIEMPEEMQKRILMNCYKNLDERMEYKTMKKNYFKKPLAVAATFALCICLTGVTALAATGKLEGFFKDITNWNGAVIGTTYEQATDEIEIEVTNATDSLTVVVTVVNPDMVPYVEFNEMKIGSYKIVDSAGNVVVEGMSNVMLPYENGQITVSIPLENLKDGNYKLIVDSFVGGKKADQPLTMKGSWECEFVK